MWSISTTRSAAELAELVRSLPRWDPKRDGFFDGTRLVCERYPPEVTDEGFRFVVPSSKYLWIVCQGQFQPAPDGTRVYMKVGPLANILFFLALIVIVLPSALIVFPLVSGFWPMDPWMAIGYPAGLMALLAAMFWVGIWWNKRWVKRRVTELFHQFEARSGSTPSSA